MCVAYTRTDMKIGPAAKGGVSPSTTPSISTVDTLSLLCSSRRSGPFTTVALSFLAVPSLFLSTFLFTQTSSFLIALTFPFSAFELCTGIPVCVTPFRLSGRHGKSSSLLEPPTISAYLRCKIGTPSRGQSFRKCSVLPQIDQNGLHSTVERRDNQKPIKLRTPFISTSMFPPLNGESVDRILKSSKKVTTREYLRLDWYRMEPPFQRTQAFESCAFCRSKEIALTTLSVCCPRVKPEKES
ncbi:hypothetical protein J437_LFUL019010 [Ladona fulva]|uniref:Uncharacterized protein n=1 Tax=Ladona fulva TaxID=123851 RepID=A0A8K0KRU9_LADFU|nr:hypothetical protein J437_LFUL019010 [Ladona fulva]